VTPVTPWGVDHRFPPPVPPFRAHARMMCPRIARTHALLSADFWGGRPRRRTAGAASATARSRHAGEPPRRARAGKAGGAGLGQRAGKCEGREREKGREEEEKPPGKAPVDVDRRDERILVLLLRSTKRHEHNAGCLWITEDLPKDRFHLTQL